jgi:hypothetical protein
VLPRHFGFDYVVDPIGADKSRQGDNQKPLRVSNHTILLVDRSSAPDRSLTVAAL